MATRIPGPAGKLNTTAGSKPMDNGTSIRQNSPTPGPSGYGASHPDTPDLYDKELLELGLDLIQMAFDLAGIVDPTPVSDGASGLLALSRGQWLDAALSGLSMVPYVGDLAKAGKLPRYLKSLERAVELANRSAKAAQALLPGLRKMKEVLDLIPSGANESIDKMKQVVNSFLRRHGAEAVAKILPDISKQYQYRTYESADRVYKSVSGRLGVPGSVMRHRSTSAQRSVSGGTGDHAGHLVGDRFGASGGIENLSQQNWKANSNGTFYQLEDMWADKLSKGSGIEVQVIDVAKKGEDRPFMRHVEWIEITPEGKRLPTQKLEFANTHTHESRVKQGIAPTVSSPQKDNVINVDFVNKKRLP